MNDAVIGFAMCGSFCTYQAVFSVLETLKERFPNIIPIMSEASYATDSRFGSASELRSKLEQLCEAKVLHTIAEVEPFGPKKLLDALVIAPCTGNTLAKFAAGIADGPVTLACKAHLRNERPVILAVSTNDGLAANAGSIGQLLNRKNFYFVPFGQDNALGKPRSLVAHFDLLPDTIESALQGQQIQPLLA